MIEGTVPAFIKAGSIEQNQRDSSGGANNKPGMNQCGLSASARGGRPRSSHIASWGGLLK